MTTGPEGLHQIRRASAACAPARHPQPYPHSSTCHLSPVEKLLGVRGAKPPLLARTSQFSGRDSPAQAFQYVERFSFSHETTNPRRPFAVAPGSVMARDPRTTHEEVWLFSARQATPSAFCGSTRKSHDWANLTNQSCGNVRCESHPMTRHARLAGWSGARRGCGRAASVRPIGFNRPDRPARARIPPRPAPTHLTRRVRACPSVGNHG